MGNLLQGLLEALGASTETLEHFLLVAGGSIVIGEQKCPGPMLVLEGVDT